MKVRKFTIGTDGFRFYASDGIYTGCGSSQDEAVQNMIRSRTTVKVLTIMLALLLVLFVVVIL